MSNLYVFAIGGSGARVIRSLTMLLGAGMKPGNFTVVPILLDLDDENGSLDAASKVLDAYTNVRNIVAGFKGEIDIFQTNMVSIKANNPNSGQGQITEKASQEANSVVSDFRFLVPPIKYGNSEVTAHDTFGTYIGLESLDPKAKKLAELLFSGKINNKTDLLNLSMDKGVVGNPNIGSVVMSNFVNSEAFKRFRINSGDRVLFITSIFGGTGAAGFPAILNKIRNYTKPGDGPNSPPIPDTVVRNSIIGSITMLPYYQVSNGEGIKSSTFIPKTKSALRYYNDSVYNSVDSFYYIGMDDPKTEFKHSIGGKEQKNQALFTELVAAAAVLDFANNTTLSENTDRMRPSDFSQYWHVESNKEGVIRFDDLESGIGSPVEIIKDMKVKLQKMFIIKSYMETGLPNDIKSGIVPWISGSKSEDIIKENDSDLTKVKDFLKKFDIWLKELSGVINDTDMLDPQFSSYENLETLNNSYFLYDLCKEKKSEFNSGVERALTMINSVAAKTLKSFSNKGV